MTSASWVNAQLHCNQFPVGGRKGWRLPSSYWSAMSDARDATTAWLVTFDDGNVLSGVVAGFAKTDSLFVWCVRGGQGVDTQ